MTVSLFASDILNIYLFLFLKIDVNFLTDLKIFKGMDSLPWKRGFNLRFPVFFKTLFQSSIFDSALNFKMFLWSTSHLFSIENK